MKKSTFLRLICPRCRNLQIVFGKSSMNVKCLKCNYLLARKSGGKARLRAQVHEVLWN
ncbi:30S ribosomal protein S27e [Candidatus Pacearchaeota archaeon]|nr:30S ribosomal protein S27e [Candidatus Pacearchaeota archaeon]